ncbi:MAG: hypothetical protein ACF8NJ_08725, partial [Phycisphaerales bacterium JB038]
MSRLLTKRLYALLLLGLGSMRAAAPAAPADTYVATRLGDLELADFEVPEGASGRLGYRNWQAPRWPYIVLDGEGEAFIAQRLDPGQWGSASWFDYNEAAVGFHLPDASAGLIRGTLFIKEWKSDAMQPIRFSLDLGDLETGAEAAYLQVKEDHYHTLLAQPIPGAAHFRHEMQQARKARLALIEADEETLTEQQRSWYYDSELEKSFAFVTGGRALAENLPLDLDLNVTAEETPTVALATIEGITVPEIDWKPLLPEERPAVDHLARFLPADQYACFFPSFQAMLQVIDEATRTGTPILQLAQPRAQDAHVQ